MREECETWDESKFVVRHSSLLYFFFQRSGRALGHARRRGHLAGGAAGVRECGGGDGALRGKLFAARVRARVLHAFLLARRFALFVAGGTPGGLFARRVVFEKHAVEHAHDADVRMNAARMRNGKKSSLKAVSITASTPNIRPATSIRRPMRVPRWRGV